jgi:hypothetical protein
MCLKCQREDDRAAYEDESQIEGLLMAYLGDDNND